MAQGRTKNSRNMSPSEDAMAYRMAEEYNWSFRRIGKQLKRSDKAVAAAVARHEKHLGSGRPSSPHHLDDGLLDDAQIARLELFLSWLDDGRRNGFNRLLVAGVGPSGTPIRPTAD